jgi:hypothetical protein
VADIALHEVIQAAASPGFDAVSSYGAAAPRADPGLDETGFLDLATTFGAQTLVAAARPRKRQARSGSASRTIDAVVLLVGDDRCWLVCVGAEVVGVGPGVRRGLGSAA